MKKFRFIFFVLAVLISCEKMEQQGEVTYAVATGKSVSSISIFNSTDDQLHAYEYLYDEDGKVIGVDKDGKFYSYQYQDGVLVNITCDDAYGSSFFSWNLTYDGEDNLIGYSVYMNDEFVIKYAFDYKGKMISCLNVLKSEDSDAAEITMPYVWKGSNLDSIGSVEFAYNQIVDNFNVPIPQLHVAFQGFFYDPLFVGFSRSENLMHTSQSSSLSEYSYQRNDEGDICRIDVDNGRLYYLIEYAD